MSLPETFQRFGTSVLARFPEVEHRWRSEADHCELFLPGSRPDGFDIRCLVFAEGVSEDAVTLHWGDWHTPLGPSEETDAFVGHLFGLLRDMLSPDMRIRELCAGGRAYRGLLEAFDGTRWQPEQTMGFLFWNYLGRRSVKTYTNAILPGRLSGPERPAAPD